MTAADFEAFLDHLAATPSVEGDTYASAVREARDRLKLHPELRRGSETEFVYNDPVLSRLLYGAQEAERLQASLLAAGEPGENLTTSWWRWAPMVCKTAFHRLTGSEEKLASLTPSAPIKLAKQRLRLAIVGDAGFSGLAQDAVIAMILGRHKSAPFDAVVHLGDVYRAADADAMKKHFLAPFSVFGFRGARVYTLLGNHDVYLGGEAYISALKALDQPGRYFCMETRNWQVACLDTTLFDTSPRRSNGGMEQTQLDWLERILHQEKPVLLLSHHYYISAWGQSGAPLMKILRPVFCRAGSPRAWYWGHEHLLAAYPKHPDGFSGACVGNGAFLEEAKPPYAFKGKTKRPDWYAKPEWFPKSKCACFDDKQRYWPHGYLEVELTPTGIEESYHLEAAPASYQRSVAI